jgi:hypothetical protein
MLFLACFSFTGRHGEGSLEGEAVSGHFNCMVDAEDVDAADRRLRALLRETRRHRNLFDGVSEVFLDALIAVKSVPRKGMITYFAEYMQEMPDTLWTAAPYTAARYCDAYSYGDEGDEEGEEGEEAEAEPFLIFDDAPATAN